MSNKNNNFNYHNLPINIQLKIDEYWSNWKNYYTNNIVNQLNFDLSINHFVVNVIKYEDVKDICNNKIGLKQFYYFKKSCEYFLNNKDYIYDLNKKI